MVENNKYDLTDLVVSAIEQKPSDFETAFNDLIVDRIHNAIETKKIEIAHQMYGYEAETEQDSNLEGQENGEEFE